MGKIQISVVIATFNSYPWIERCLTSVFNQSVKNYEVIVVDGGSVDNTINVLQKYNGMLKYISEKDRGIADAFNKGVAMSRGEYIYFLGSDDMLRNDTVFAQVSILLEANPVLLAGRICRVERDSQIHIWTSPKIVKFNRNSLLFTMSLPHQGLFTRRDYFSKYGLFDTSNKYSMDYELLLRAYNDFPQVLVTDVIIANWSNGGVGQGSLELVFDEYHNIKLKNKIVPKILLNMINIYLHIKLKIRFMLGFGYR